MIFLHGNSKDQRINPGMICETRKLWKPRSERWMRLSGANGSGGELFLEFLRNIILSPKL